MLDGNSDGYVDEFELAHALRAAGLSVSDQDVANMIEHADTHERDGKVSLAEFEQLMLEPASWDRREWRHSSDRQWRQAVASLQSMVKTQPAKRWDTLTNRVAVLFVLLAVATWCSAKGAFPPSPKVSEVLLLPSNSVTVWSDALSQGFLLEAPVKPPPPPPARPPRPPPPPPPDSKSERQTCENPNPAGASEAFSEAFSTAYSWGVQHLSKTPISIVHRFSCLLVFIMVLRALNSTLRAFDAVELRWWRSVPAAALVTLLLWSLGVTSMVAVLVQDLTIVSLGLVCLWIFWVRLLANLSRRDFQHYRLSVEHSERNLAWWPRGHELILDISYATPSRSRANHWVGLFDHASRELDRKHINQRGVVKLRVPPRSLSSGGQYSVVLYERREGFCGFDFLGGSSAAKCELRLDSDGRRMWFRAGETTMV
jgi:hypothetical protein